MRKFIAYLPVMLTVLGTVWGLIDPKVTAYLMAHAQMSAYLGAAFVVSETLAGTDLVKSNSIAQAILAFLDAVLGKVLHKDAK